MSDAIRDDSVRVDDFDHVSPACETNIRTTKGARYCSAACRQRAFRHRRAAGSASLQDVTAELRRQRQLVAQTVYQCSRCEGRLLGEYRCPDCNLMCRRLGLGGPCPHCDDLVVTTDFLP